MALAKGGSKKGERRGGRKKGTPNKRTLYIARLRELGFDPFEILKKVANGEVTDTKVIGRNKVTGAPIAVDVPLTWDLRLKAAMELCQYIESKVRGNEQVDPYEHDRNVAETGRIADGLRSLEALVERHRGGKHKKSADHADGGSQTIN